MAQNSEINFSHLDLASFFLPLWPGFGPVPPYAHDDMRVFFFRMSFTVSPSATGPALRATFPVHHWEVVETLSAAPRALSGRCLSHTDTNNDWTSWGYWSVFLSCSSWILCLTRFLFCFDTQRCTQRHVCGWPLVVVFWDMIVFWPHSQLLSYLLFFFCS